MRNLIKLAIVGALLGILLAACGGGGSSSSSSTAEAPAARETEPAADEETGGSGEEEEEEAEGSGGAEEGWSAAATKEAEEAGTAEAKGVKPVEIEPITVGYIDSLGSAEIQQRTLHAAEAAAELLGWKIAYCDAKGVPSAMTACANTLLNEHVDAMISSAMSPALFTAQLKRAKSEGIPWVNTEDKVENVESFTGSVAPDDKEASETLSEYFAERLGEESGEQEASVLTYAAIYGVKERQEGFEEVVAAHPIKIVETHESNLEALEEDSKKTIEASLKQHPNLAGVYCTVDGQQAGVASAFRTMGLAGKEFPERPLLVGFFGDKLNLKLIGEGLMDAVIEWPLEVNSWATFDQLAAYMSREKEIENTMPPGGYSLNLAPPELITDENLPPEGELVRPEHNYEAFFTSKWSAEYTNVE
jgi:ABC-type sugar transport system substrate-binding protein